MKVVPASAKEALNAPPIRKFMRQRPLGPDLGWRGGGMAAWTPPPAPSPEDGSARTALLNSFNNDLIWIKQNYKLFLTTEERLNYIISYQSMHRISC